MSVTKVEMEQGPARRQASVQDSIVVTRTSSSEIKAEDIRHAGKGHNPFSGKWLQGLYNYLSGRFQRQEDMFVHLAKENASLHATALAGVQELKKAIAEAASITTLRKEVEALRGEKAKLLAELADVHEKLRGLEAVSQKMDEAATQLQAAKASYLGVLPIGTKGLVDMIAGGGKPTLQKPNDSEKKEGGAGPGPQPPIGT